MDVFVIQIYLAGVGDFKCFDYLYSLMSMGNKIRRTVLQSNKHFIKLKNPCIL